MFICTSSFYSILYPEAFKGSTSISYLCDYMHKGSPNPFFPFVLIARPTRLPGSPLTGSSTNATAVFAAVGLWRLMLSPKDYCSGGQSALGPHRALEQRLKQAQGLGVRWPGFKQIPVPYRLYASAHVTPPLGLSPLLK